MTNTMHKMPGAYESFQETTDPFTDIPQAILLTAVCGTAWFLLLVLIISVFVIILVLLQTAFDVSLSWPGGGLITDKQIARFVLTWMGWVVSYYLLWIKRYHNYKKVLQKKREQEELDQFISKLNKMEL